MDALENGGEFVDIVANAKDVLADGESGFGREGGEVWEREEMRRGIHRGDGL